LFFSLFAATVGKYSQNFATKHKLRALLRRWGSETFAPSKLPKSYFSVPCIESKPTHLYIFSHNNIQKQTEEYKEAATI
jgi:hypothetical protein